MVKVNMVTERSYLLSAVFLRLLLISSMSILFSSNGVEADNTKNAFSNCRDLPDKEKNQLGQVQWQLDPNDKSFIMFKLSGYIKDTEYIALGFSPEDKNQTTQMKGADAVVAYCTDDCSKFHADDYYLGDTKACNGPGPGLGSCPDEQSNQTGKNDIEVLNGGRRDGVITILFKRPLKASDSAGVDKSLDGKMVNIFGAIGELGENNIAKYHAKKRTAKEENIVINPNGDNDYNCSQFVDGLEPKVSEANGLKSWSKISLVVAVAAFEAFLFSITV